MFVFSCRFEGDEEKDLESNDGFCDDPPRKGCGEDESRAKAKSSIPSRSRGPKRPDKPLYVPRAARERRSHEGSQGLSGDRDSSGPGWSSVSYVSPSRDSCPGPEPPESTESSSAGMQECPPSVTDRFLSRADGSPALCPNVPTPSDTEPPVCDQITSALAEIRLEEDEKDSEDFASVLTQEVCLHVFIVCKFIAIFIYATYTKCSGLSGLHIFGVMPSPLCYFVFQLVFIFFFYV